MSSRTNNHFPLHAQVEEQIALRISERSWPAGHQLPSEEELIGEFGVSRTTIRTAVQHLLQRGLVEIRRGRGTFAAEPILHQALTDLTGFVEDMELLGRTATARVIDKTTIKATARVAERLRLVKGAPVVQIRRVRLANGRPLSFDETYLHVPLGRRVMKDDLESEPIFKLLEDKYETPLVEADYVLEASIAGGMVATALEVSIGSPIFRIERTCYTTSNRPVDYEILHYRGDLVRFKTRLKRRRGRSRAA